MRIHTHTHTNTHKHTHTHTHIYIYIYSIQKLSISSNTFEYHCQFLSIYNIVDNGQVIDMSWIFLLLFIIIYLFITYHNINNTSSFVLISKRLQCTLYTIRYTLYTA